MYTAPKEPPAKSRTVFGFWMVRRRERVRRRCFHSRQSKSCRDFMPEMPCHFRGGEAGIRTAYDGQLVPDGWPEDPYKSGP
jgi:hypothetical protein